MRLRKPAILATGMLGLTFLLQCAQSTWPEQDARSIEAAPASFSLWPDSLTTALPSDTLLVAWKGLPRGLACARLNSWAWEYNPTVFKWEGLAEFRWPATPDCALEQEGFDTAFTLIAPAEEEDLVFAGRKVETRIRLQAGVRIRIPIGGDSTLSDGFWFRDSTAEDPRRFFGHSTLDACTLLEGALLPAGAGSDKAWGLVLQLEEPFLSDAGSCDARLRADSIEVLELPESLPDSWPSRFRPE